MGLPIFGTESETTWNDSTNTKTASVSVFDASDLLVVLSCTEDNAYPLGTPTGASLTYTSAQLVSVANYTRAQVWTAPSISTSSFSVSISESPTDIGWWGANVLKFSGTQGVGASSKTNVASGAPSLGLTTTQDNSAIAVIVGDWSAQDGTTRTWRTVNGITPTAGNGLEVTYFRDSSHYAVYVAYYTDAGAAGAKTVGLSAPGSQKYSIIAVEILGAVRPNVQVINMAAIMRAGSW